MSCPAQSTVPLRRTGVWRVAAALGAVVLPGYYNANVKIEGVLASLFNAPFNTAAGAKVKIRFPDRRALRFDRRDWPSEEELLCALAEVPELKDIVPKVVRRLPCASVQSFAEGTVLEELAPTGAALAETYLDGIEQLFRVISGVSPDGLAAQPAIRLKSSCEFLETQVSFTFREVYQRCYPRYRLIFDGLGVTPHTFQRYVECLPEVRSRPLTLLHGDLHRRNIVVRPDGELFLLDWELALCGDPVYELATHLWLTGYPDSAQFDDVVSRWKRAVGGVSPKLVAGVDDDLPLYLDYKRVQSLVTDVIRCADRFDPTDQHSVESAAQTVGRVLREAAEPLRLSDIAGKARIIELYRAWFELSSGRRKRRWWHRGAPGRPVRPPEGSRPSPESHGRPEAPHRTARPSVEYVLFDFDGPICALFAHHSAADIARTIKAKLAENYELPMALAESDDPHDILLSLGRMTGAGAARPRQEPGTMVTAVEEMLAFEEWVAAGTARPTEGAADLIRRLHREGVAVAIVSNNSESAVRRYLERVDLADVFGDHIHGRLPEPRLMKPSPHLLEAALGGLGARPEQCVMVGDSPADVHAAKAAGIAFIGCAWNERKRGRLLDAGCQAARIVASVTELSTLLSRLRSPGTDAEGEQAMRPVGDRAAGTCAGTHVGGAELPSGRVEAAEEGVLSVP